MSNPKIDMSPVAGIIKKHGLDKDGDIQRFATQTAIDLMDKHVPYRHGFLRESALNLGNMAVYGGGNVPYAKRLYYNPEYNFNEAPQRGAYWDKKMMADSKDIFFRTIQKYVEGGN